MKRSIGLANAVCTTKNAPALKQTLKRAIEETVGRCRAERKRARALETPKDLSDGAVCRAASWTDRLPLSDYDNVLHLTPRLVNVVTVCCAPLNSFAHTCSCRRLCCCCCCCIGSSQRPSPSRGRGSSCPSTCTPSARAARMPTTRLDALRPCNWPLTSRAAASWSSTLAGSSAPVRCLLLSTLVFALVTERNASQAARARWPPGSPSCAPRASWPSKPTCTSTCATSK